MKKIWLTLAVLSTVGLLAGCNKPSSDDKSTGYSDPGTVSELVNDYPFMVTDTSVFVKRDGSVISADVEDFSADYYDLKEFEENYLIPAVKEYNEKQGLSFTKADETKEKLPVAIHSLELEDKNLVMQLSYKNADDYLAFNKDINKYFKNWKQFVICPYADLADKEISLDAEFLDAQGNPVDINNVKATSGLYACVIDFGGALPSGFSGKFQFEGKVMYTTENIIIQGDNSVRVYDSESLQYILFK